MHLCLSFLVPNSLVCASPHGFPCVHDLWFLFYFEDSHEFVSIPSAFFPFLLMTINSPTSAAYLVFLPVVPFTRLGIHVCFTLSLSVSLSITVYVFASLITYTLFWDSAFSPATFEFFWILGFCHFPLALLCMESTYRNSYVNANLMVSSYYASVTDLSKIWYRMALGDTISQEFSLYFCCASVFETVKEKLQSHMWCSMILG